MTVCLGLDLAEKTGWSFGDNPRTLHFGTWTLPGFSDRDMPRSMSSIECSVRSFVKANKIEFVVIEAPLHLAKRSSHTQRCLTMLAGAAIAGAVTGGAKSVILPSPQTWRKAVLGHGFPKDPKAAAIHYCRKLSGWNVLDDNSADACCLWQYMMGKVKSGAML